MSADHDHEHDHHNAPPNPYLERRRDERETADLAKRVETIEALLIEKGLVSKEALDTLVDIYENDIGPMNGARVVARAWTDEAYKQHLLEDATAAIATHEDGLLTVVVPKAKAQEEAEHVDVKIGLPSAAAEAEEFEAVEAVEQPGAGEP